MTTKSISFNVATTMHDACIEKSASWTRIARKLSAPSTGPKEGPVFIPASLSAQQRRAENVQSITMLVFDLDNKNNQLTDITLRRLLESTGFTSIYHTTYSSTSSNQRFRLILPLSRPLSP